MKVLKSTANHGILFW